MSLNEGLLFEAELKRRVGWMSAVEEREGRDRFFICATRKGGEAEEDGEELHRVEYP